MKRCDYYSSFTAILCILSCLHLELRITFLIILERNHSAGVLPNYGYDRVRYSIGILLLFSKTVCIVSYWMTFTGI